MKTFRMIGMALFAVLMCVNFTACGSDEEEEEIVKKSTFEMLKGVWFSGNNSEDYPYFIVENGFCYFSPDHNIVSTADGEKYKFTFDENSNILTCYQFDFQDNHYFDFADYFRVKTITTEKLVLEFLDDEDKTVKRTKNFTRFK